MKTLILDPNKRYTFADYLTWADDKRRELFNGLVQLMTPAPIRHHQEVAINISTELHVFLKKQKCKVYSAPFDVRLQKNGETKNDSIYTVVQPDIVVVCDMNKLDDKGCIGAPDFIVEIISPSTSKIDLKDKYFIYEEAGVKEYWIAFPNEKSIHKFVLNNKNKYQLIGMFVEGDKISPSIFPNLELDITEIFEM